MKKRVLALSAAILITLGSGAAYAGETLLYSPMLSAPTGGWLWCNVTNVGKKPIPEIRVELVASSGSGFTDCANVPPQSSSSPSATCWGGMVGSTRAVCMVRITGGSHKSVRPVFNVQDSSGATILSVPLTK